MWENPIRNFVRRVKLRDEVLVNKVANEEGDGRRMGNLTMTYEVLGSLALTESFPCLVFTRFDQNVKYSFPCMFVRSSSSIVKTQCCPSISIRLWHPV